MEDKENFIALRNEQLEVHSLQCDKVKLIINDEHELIQEDGNYYIVRKKPQYPKTYEECCEKLQIPKDESYIDIDVPLSYNKVLNVFTQLLICRKAYWKIAGEELGLKKPWEPDYTDKHKRKYSIWVDSDKIKTDEAFITTQMFLTFPTKEMRDIFYENFKDLIEQCKQLL